MPSRDDDMEDDDEDFEVSDHMINDSIFQQQRTQNKAHFSSVGDDDDLSPDLPKRQFFGKANVVEPQLLDYLSQSTYTKPLQFANLKNSGGQTLVGAKKSLSLTRSKQPQQINNNKGANQ